uniref:Uncharacterized protein n=1 Tax=Anopheles dirus TaxID=7168 RepID=A0A182NW23_9DIPT
VCVCVCVVQKSPKRFLVSRQCCWLTLWNAGSENQIALHEAHRSLKNYANPRSFAKLTCLSGAVFSIKRGWRSTRHSPGVV